MADKLCNDFPVSNTVLVLYVFAHVFLIQATSYDLHGAGREGEGEKTREKTGGRGNTAAGHMGEIHHPHQTPGTNSSILTLLSVKM